MVLWVNTESSSRLNSIPKVGSIYSRRDNGDNYTEANSEQRRPEKRGMEEQLEVIIFRLREQLPATQYPATD